MAVARSILVILYHLLREKETYHEPDPTCLDDRRHLRVQQRALDQLRALGFDVTITPKVPAA